MKKLKVSLEFFQDDATGEYGVAPSHSINCNNPFNAFWNGIGLFHDVFEHYFEDKHDYFIGKNSFNIAGEMAAMGHAYAYYEMIGSDRELGPGYRSFTDTVIETTGSMIVDIIEHGGHTEFGETLECSIPKQKPVYNGYSDIENTLGYYWDKTLKVLIPNKHAYDEDSLEQAREYKKSMTKGKYLNAHRWGYRQALKIVAGDEGFNSSVLSEFIEFWNLLCENVGAEELINLGFDRIEFEVYKVHGQLRWKAVFENGAGREFNKTFKSLSLPKHISEEEFWPIEKEEFY